MSLSLRKEVGLLGLVAFGVGTIIGGDYLVVNSFIISSTGASVVLAYMLAGVLILVVALNYCELMVAMPYAGAEYVYISEAFGSTAGFILGWLAVLGWSIAIGINGIVIGDFMSVYIPEAVVPRWVWSVISVMVVWYLNHRGIRLASLAEVITTLGLVFALLAYAFVGFTHMEVSNLTPFFVNGFSGFLYATAFATLFYLGFNMVAQLAEEAKIPRRELWKVIVYVIVGVALVLVITNLSTVLMAPYSSIVNVASSEWPLSVLLKPFIGDLGVALVTLFAVFLGALTTMMGCYVVSARFIFAFARGGLLPKTFMKLHPKYGSPYVALLVGLGAGLIGSFIRRLIDYASLLVVMSLVAFILVALSLMWLRRKKPNLERPFKVPLYPITPVATMVFASILLVAFITELSFDMVVLIIAWLVLGYLIMKLYTRRGGG